MLNSPSNAPAIPFGPDAKRRFSYTFEIRARPCVLFQPTLIRLDQHIFARLYSWTDGMSTVSFLVRALL